MFDFIVDAEELARFLEEVTVSRPDGLGNSKVYDGYRYWNATGDEFAVGFPTVYWRKELESEALGMIE